MDWPSALTSAAAGAVIASAIAFYNGHLERKARRRELLFTRALDLAKSRAELLSKMAENEQIPFSLREDVALAAEYLDELELLISTGKLSAKFEREDNQRQLVWLAQTRRRLVEAKSPLFEGLEHLHGDEFTRALRERVLSSTPTVESAPPRKIE